MTLDIPDTGARKNPPASVVRWFDPFLIAVIICGIYALGRHSSLSALQLSLVIIVAIIAVMVPIEFMQAPWRGTTRPDIPLSIIFKRTGIKTLGILFGAGLMASAWLLIHEYRYEDYQPLFEILPYAVLVTPPLVAATVFYTEWRLGPSEDHSWQFGLLALGRWREVDWATARLGLFGWIVKGFFLPMNFVGAVQDLADIRKVDPYIFKFSWPQIEGSIDQMIFTALVLAIIPGYMFSTRLLGTENRRIDQTAFGWLVTLLCYSPMNAGTGNGWFYYEGPSRMMGSPWIVICGSSGILSYSIGGLLVFFGLLHYWGEATCHIRSSHLSHRGVITNGIFRYCKHPVYASKCLAWTLMYLPFLSGDTLLENMRESLAFLAFCGVYVLRGWIEERLLSNDPIYREYGLWMDRHSLFRFVGRVIPVFRYEWRLRWWIRKRQLQSLIESQNEISTIQ